MASDGTVGRKIAAARKRRGLSQREFGGLLERSETWVSQVERGVRTIDRMTVLERVADVLGVPVAEFAADTPFASVAHDRGQAVSDLALTLVATTAFGATVVRKGDRRALRAGVKRAWEYAHSSSYFELGELLLELLPQLESAAADHGDGEVHEALARAYHAAAAVLSKLGQTAAAWVACDRAIAAARKTGDELLMAEGAFRLTVVFHGARWLDLARHTATSALESLARLDPADPAAKSVAGALELQLAVIAARVDDSVEAYGRLDRAWALANALGAERNDYNTEFGPTNVSLHEVAIAVELGDAGRAVRVSEGIDPLTLSPERQSRFLVDVARARAQRREVELAVDALTHALAIASVQVEAHPVVRSVVTDLLQMAPNDKPVRALAGRIGLTR